jgi:putative salt-induced outer membrane protein YdiY
LIGAVGATRADPIFPLPTASSRTHRPPPARTRGAALCLLAAAAAAPAFADTVVLIGGDRLSGKILHKSAETLTLETEYAGKVRIAWKNVATLSTDAPLEVLRAGSQAPERLALEQGEPGSVVVRYGGDSERFTVPLASLVYLNPKPEESGLGLSYTGRVNVSATRARGNSAFDRLYGEAELKARAKHYRYALSAQTQREEEAGQRIASRTVVSGTHDRFLGAKSFWYLRGSLEHDRFKDIDLRTTAGAGYGLRLIDTESTELSLRGGLDAVRIDRISDGDERYPALGWGLGYSHWTSGRQLQLFHDQQGFWNLEDRNEASVRSKTGVRVPVAERLTASAQLNLDWEREPAPGRKAVDTTWLLGLGYDW